MENSNQQPKENMSVAKFDPAITYAGASTLLLTESEMKALSAPFDDLDYEITPNGFIYLPQALSLIRLNSVLGVGRWSLLLINTGSQHISDKMVKVFYDGALIIRNCFTARAAGESSYSLDNGNYSYATALEGAKSDCRQRCCKDLGIGTDAWNPTFIRRWQKEHAVKVWVEKDWWHEGVKKSKREIAWRRKDLDAFHNEIGLVSDTPTVPSQQNNQQTKEELPWLNPGPEYDKALKELLEGKTIKTLRKVYRISQKTMDAILEVLTKEWATRLNTCNNLTTLTKSYNDNAAEVEEYPWLKDMFTERRKVIQSGKVKAA